MIRQILTQPAAQLARALSSIPLVLSLLLIASCTNVALPPKDTPEYSAPDTPSTRPAPAVVQHPLAELVLDPTSFEAETRQRKEQWLARYGEGVTLDDVGYYMDIQEARLRQQLAGKGVAIERVGDDIVLHFPGAITFTEASAKLSKAIRPALDSTIDVLLEYRKTLVAVFGHTDSIGDSAYNQTLSEQRGLSLADYLVAGKVPAERIVVVGQGESRPIAANDSEAGREQNRRVDLRIEPILD